MKYKKMSGGKNRKKVWRECKERAAAFFLFLPALLFCLPVAVLVTGSVMGSGELRECLQPVFMEGTEFISWKLIPDYPAFENYGKLLFLTPQFFVLFWNSVKMTGGILGGQLIIGVPAAWAFAAYRTKGSRILFVLYVALMLLPFQVTMLSGYLVLKRLKLLDTYGAVILPGVFSTFPVFLSYGGFRSIPQQLLDAARTDGAGEFTVFFRVGLPLGKSGILSALVLGFLNAWNMLEQPMAFLSDKTLWPLSLYLPEITWTQAGSAFCASVITLVPAVFVFVFGQDYLEKGILYSGLK